MLGEILATDILAKKMKNKKTIYILMSVFVALLLCVSWTLVGFTQTKTANAELSFKGNVNKETLNLGEPITVEFEFTNTGENPVMIGAEGVEVGSLKIFIADKGGEYKRYTSGAWGRERGRKITLEPNQSLKYKGAVILWNGKPNVSHLNEDAAKLVLAGKITTEYALPEPGVYFIKGLSYFGENATPIESEPIKVVIKEPVGDDLEVWNQIKGNKEIAFLMQHGGFDTGKDARKEQLMTKVEQIIVQYPNSIYSGYLKPNLEKYKADEIRRKEYIEKGKIKP
jgi:hypothetical protein